MKEIIKNALTVASSLLISFFILSGYLKILKYFSVIESNWGGVYLIFGTLIVLGTSMYLFLKLFSFLLGSLDSKNAIIKKIKKQLPKWTEFKKTDTGVLASWFEGQRQSPDRVHVYEFDIKKQTALFYINSTGKDIVFEGSIEEGLKRL